MWSPYTTASVSAAPTSALPPPAHSSSFGSQLSSSSNASASSSSGIRPSPLRLIVTQSLILPRIQRVAILDAHHEVSIGRDISPDPTAPRLRLKEMAVSKFHASIFFSSGTRTWSIVDLGSVHGTTVNGTRLSGARQASPPHQLKHGDSITAGSTTFVVHIHRDALPCTECVVVQSGENGIPLFDARSREVRVSGKPVVPPPPQQVPDLSFRALLLNIS